MGQPADLRPAILCEFESHHCYELLVPSFNGRTLGYEPRDRSSNLLGTTIISGCDPCGVVTRFGDVIIAGSTPVIPTNKLTTH